MKRELLQNVKVQPYTSADAVDRTGFLSAILGIKISTAGELTLTITHGDTDAAADVVTDKKVFPTEASSDGTVTLKDLQTDDMVNLDIDLLGLKNFVKITASGTAAGDAKLAIALGDTAVQPV